MASRFLKLSLWAVVAVATMNGLASAQDGGVTRLLVPYVPGGFPDTVARIVANQLQADTGQTFVVENRPGGAGLIAAEMVAKSTPDGHTLLVADAQQWGIAPAIYKDYKLDAERDFAPVVVLGTTGNFLVANAEIARDFPSLVALVRANPNKYFYGTPGIGTLHQLTFEALKARLDLKMTNVPYKGGSEVVAAIMGGQVAMAVQAMPSIKALADQGKLRVLAITLNKRSKYMPDVPTFEQLGVPDMNFPGDLGVLAPAGTPPAVLARLEAAMIKAVTSPAVSERLAAFAIESAGGSAAEFGKLIHNDIIKFRQGVEAAGIQPN